MAKETEAVKLAREETARQIAAKLIALLEHPVYSILICAVIVEYLQSRGLMGNVIGTAIETAVISKGAIESISKSGALEALPGLLPLLVK